MLVEKMEVVGGIGLGASVMRTWMDGVGERFYVAKWEDGIKRENWSDCLRG